MSVGDLSGIRFLSERPFRVRPFVRKPTVRIEHSKARMMGRREETERRERVILGDSVFHFRLILSHLTSPSDHLHPPDVARARTAASWKLLLF